MIQVTSIVGGCFSCGTGKRSTIQANIIKIKNDYQESAEIALCNACSSELATKLNAAADSPGIVPGSPFQVHDRVAHYNRGDGMILGNRHKHGNMWYWHVGFNDGTFDYCSERSLQRIGTI